MRLFKERLAVYTEKIGGVMYIQGETNLMSYTGGSLLDRRELTICSTEGK